jgi:hypothetical protein
MADLYEDDILRRSEQRGSLLRRLAAEEAWPQSRDAPHWRSEMRVACANAADEFSLSMRRHVARRTLTAANR